MGTVGNEPSAANPAGTAVPTLPQSEPDAADSFEYSAGSLGNYPNAGMADTAAVVAAGLAVAAAATADYMAQAHVFITENGAQVLAGHQPVNPAPPEMLEAGGGAIVDAG